MQLDNNRLVIRERGWLDLLDLGLCVTRAYAGPLMATLLAGVVPAMVLNAWLLAGFAHPSSEEPFPAEYMTWMLLLVIWEIPVVTALATLYLGEAIFQERPKKGALARSLWRALPQLIWYQVVLRAVLIPWFVTWFIPFSLWPYLNEVILLERNPLRRRRPGQMTTFRRSQSLHGGSGGDLFARWLASAAFGLMLFASLWLSMQLVARLLLNEGMWAGLTFTLYYPLALWTVVGYFTVVRFLGYLDLRIRREGWEVELMMRAEGARLSRQLT